jgi:hypothetical protein
MSENSSRSPVYSITEARIKTLFEEIRPPEHIRSQLDFEYTFDKNTFVLFEVSPGFKDENEKTKMEVVKARYIIRREEWDLYWMPGNLKWKRYETEEPVKTIDEVFEIIDEDKYACFFG